MFGRLGDLVGRKHTFLVTILIMGFSTFLVGILPSYASIGVLAPVALIALRLLQGLALGGEYGGAATYVAEHAPHERRGLHTSFIQTTATLGLFLSLLVILACRAWLGTEAFEAWGWRIPFLVSAALLAISVWIRLQLNESPLFLQMKAEGKRSKAPLTESFPSKNGRIVALALFGATAGQAVVWYCGQFYALFFLTQILKVDATPANLLIAGALAIGTPFFVLFGWLSDKIGRKPVIMAGCLVAALTYFPIFTGSPGTATGRWPRRARRARCRSRRIRRTAAFSSTRSARSSSPRRATWRSRRSRIAAFPTRTSPRRRERPRRFTSVRSSLRSYERGAPGSADAAKRFDAELKAALQKAGYPEKSDSSKLNVPMLLRAADDSGGVRRDGVRADCGVARGAVPDAHPLYLDVAALPYRQRMVRRLPADDGVCARRDDREYLSGALVSNHRRGRDRRDGDAVSAGDAARRYFEVDLGERMQGPSTQDRLEIYELYARYSWALDTGDTDGYVALFTKDAHRDGGDA